MTTQRQSSAKLFRVPSRILCATFLELAVILFSPVSSPSAIPSDPMFGQQWYLQRIGATNAWQVTTGSTEVVVAVFDTGVDYTHQDLAPNMWRNPGETGLDDNGNDKATNGIDDDGNGYVDDVYGVNVWDGTGDPMDTGWFEPPYPTVFHGTANAGVIGAVGNNGVGIAGVNWSVKIMAIKVITGDLTASPSPLQFYSDGGMLAAWNYVLEMKRRGVNIRVTSHSEGLTAYSPAVRDAIIAAGNEGILTVVAADNNSIDHDLFSTYANVQNLAPILYVAATDESDQLAWFSDYGKSTVHLAAPGVNILTTTRGGGYTTLSGTSLACPMVAGAAALMASLGSGLTADRIKAGLMASVDHPPALEGKLVSGGRLNVGRAIDYLMRMRTVPVVVTALPAGQRTRPDAPIQVTFSRWMTRETVETNFVITPAVAGRFEGVGDPSFIFIYHHDAPFDSTTNYTVRIRGEAFDDGGLSGFPARLDGNFNGLTEGSPADDYVWTFGFPVSNDNFADARPLTNTSGTITGTTHYTDYEDGEPTQGRAFDPYFAATVWYRWTNSGPDGWVTFDLTSGTAFDSYLAVYAGYELATLRTIATNDNYGAKQTSRVSFGARGGSNYWISVIGKSWQTDTTSGPFELSWYPTPPPTFSAAPFSRTNAYAGQMITLSGTNFTGVTRVLFNGVPTEFNVSTNAAFTDLELTATAPPGATTGPITIETPHGSVTTSSNFTVLLRPIMAIRNFPGTNLVELSWPSVTGFTLQRADSLGSTGWATASAISTRLTNGTRFVIVTNAVPNRFFRLYRP